MDWALAGLCGQPNLYEPKKHYKKYIYSDVHQVELVVEIIDLISNENLDSKAPFEHAYWLGQQAPEAFGDERNCGDISLPTSETWRMIWTEASMGAARIGYQVLLYRSICNVFPVTKYRAYCLEIDKSSRSNESERYRKQRPSQVPLLIAAVLGLAFNLWLLSIFRAQQTAGKPVYRLQVSIVRDDILCIIFYCDFNSLLWSKDYKISIQISCIYR